MTALDELGASPEANEGCQQHRTADRQEEAGEEVHAEEEMGDADRNGDQAPDQP
jgi:hypothetical protein